MTVSTSGMVVSLEPESRFPMSGHEGHDGRNTQNHYETYIKANGS